MCSFLDSINLTYDSKDLQENLALKTILTLVCVCCFVALSINIPKYLFLLCIIYRPSVFFSDWVSLALFLTS